MSKRKPYINYLAELVDLIGTRTTCIKKKVGCVILNNKGHILATGYNGVARNAVHCVDVPCKENCMAIHAEQNAIAQCTATQSIYLIVCSLAPCIDCAKLISTTSCKKFYYVSKYKTDNGIDYLQQIGVDIKQISSGVERSAETFK